MERKAVQSDPERRSLPWSTLVPTAQRRSGHRSTLVDLSFKLPGMVVDGSTTKYIKQKRKSQWRLGGALQTSKQKPWH